MVTACVTDHTFGHIQRPEYSILILYCSLLPTYGFETGSLTDLAALMARLSGKTAIGISACLCLQILGWQTHGTMFYFLHGCGVSNSDHHITHQALPPPQPALPHSLY